MKLKLLPIALLAVVGLGLSACTPETVTTTTSEQPTTTTTTSEDPNPVTTFEISNKAELQAEWPINMGNRQIKFNIVPAANVNTLINNGELVITSSNTSVVSVSQTYLVPVAEGSATITATYSGHTDTVDVTIAAEQVMKLEDIRAGISDGSITEGDVLTFNGVITATMAESDIGDGVYVQDGDYALMLYSGTLENDWAANELAIGDTVHVEGSLSPYNGLNEVVPTVVEKVEDDSIATPTALNITAENYSADGLAGQDGRLFVIEDAAYKNGTVNIGSHSNIYFTLENGEEDVEVTFRVNYHLGNDTMSYIKGVVDGLEEGDLVDLYGVVSWYNGPQLSPQILDGRDAKDNVVPSVALPNPTAISLSAESTNVKVGSNVTLTTTFTPDRSNHAVTWSSSDPTVATINELTGGLSFVKEGTVTITATSRLDTNVKGTITFNVSSDSLAPTLHQGMPVDGQQYLYGLYQENTNTNLYATGSNDGNYLATTSDYSTAGVFTAHVTSDNKISLQHTSGQYLAIVTSGTYVNAQMSSEEFLFDYNSEYNTLTAVVGEDTYYIGTYNTFTTFSASKLSYAATSFPGHLYVPAEGSIVEPSNPVLVDTPAAGQYLLGFANASTTYYLTGVMSGYYLGASANPNDAGYITVASSGEGWTLQNEEMKYIGAVISGTYLNPSVQDEAFVWNWDSTNKAFTAQLDAETSVFLGGRGTYSTAGVYNVTNLTEADYWKCQLFTYTKVEEPKPETPTIPENAVQVDVAFDSTFNSGFTTITEDGWSKTVDQGIVISAARNSGSNIAITGETLNYIDPIRIYQNHTLTFEAPEGYEVFAIINIDSASDKAFGPDNASAADASGTSLTVLPDSVYAADGTASITITALNQYRLYSLTVVLVPVAA